MKKQNADLAEVEETTKEPKPDRREVISVSVSPEEKRKISVEALKKYNTSVSDLIRKRMFLDHEADEHLEKDPTESEDVHKEVIQELKADILELEEENATLKLKLSQAQTEKVNPEPNKSTQVYGVVLSFEDNEDGENLLDLIKEHRAELFENLPSNELEDFYDFDKFIKTLFMRGLKRTFNNGMLREETGLSISTVKLIAQLEDIDYSEKV